MIEQTIVEADKDVVEDALAAGFTVFETEKGGHTIMVPRHKSEFSDITKEVTKLLELRIERQRSNGDPVVWVTPETADYFGKAQDSSTGVFRYGQYEYASIPLFTAPQESPIPKAFKGMPLLNADEIALLHRFVETTEDDSSYDLSPEEVQRLAKYGALRHNGGGHYSITEFGQWLSAAPSAPIEAQLSYADGLEEINGCFTSFFDLMNAYANKPHGEGVGGNSPHAVLAQAYGIIANASISLNALIPSTQAPKEVK